MFPKFLLTLGIYAALLCVVGELVDKNVPAPYMDEIFHIPQAQRYCAGNFTQWDNKITTLPGLYLFTVGLLEPVYKLSSALDLELGGETESETKLCSVRVLRTVNLLMSLMNLVLLHTITTHLHGDKENYSEVLGMWSSLNMALMPVLFMFSFLYYTDQISTALVLLTFSLHLALSRPLGPPASSTETLTNAMVGWSATTIGVYCIFL